MLKSTIFVLLALVAVSHGVQQTNYDLSRKKIGSSSNGDSLNYDLSRNGIGSTKNEYDAVGGAVSASARKRFGIRDIWQYFIGGGGYGHPYPGGYYPGQYPGGYGPGGPGLPGPPGAHPNCPLCDSSVYDYCSYKQDHDSCCCDNIGYRPFLCRMSNCRSLYANSCEEYHLISTCCCVDVQKNAVPIAVPVVV